MHVREVLSRGTNKESLKVMVEKCRSEDKGKFKGGSAVANAVERREGGGGLIENLPYPFYSVSFLKWAICSCTIIFDEQLEWVY